MHRLALRYAVEVKSRVLSFAQVNIAKMHTAIGNPDMVELASRIEEMNQLAEQSKGFDGGFSVRRQRRTLYVCSKSIFQDLIQ